MPPTFLEDLTFYLRNLEQNPEDTGPPSPAWATALLLRALARVEAGDSQNRRADPKGWLTYWRDEDRIERFVRGMDHLLRCGLAKTAAERRRLTEVGLLRWWDVYDEPSTGVHLLELDHLVKEVVTSVDTLPGPSLPGAADYALAIRAVIEEEKERRVVAPIGKVFLGLPNRDALRWLLLVEVTQSIGPKDPLLLSHELVAALSEKIYRWTDDNTKFPFPWSIMNRLAGMGLVSLGGSKQRGSRTVKLEPIGQELFAEMRKPEGSPLSVLASTLCRDLVMSAARTATGEVDAESMIAASAFAEQGNLVVHEIRNTLLPVRSALDALYRERPLDPALERHRIAIDKGIAHVFSFLTDLNRAATVAASPAEPFDVRPAIEEATEAVDLPAGVGLEVDLGTSLLPALRGNRRRFILALRNLLRNACQHGGPRLSRIRMEVAPVEHGRALRLLIDDDGQGVPEDKRELIFLRGVSLSPGGTGQGLPESRLVFEREFKGSLRCEPSPLLGARFHIQILAAGASR